jgi:hypothetical protein
MAIMPAYDASANDNPLKSRMMGIEYRIAFAESAKRSLQTVLPDE